MQMGICQIKNFLKEIEILKKSSLIIILFQMTSISQEQRYFNINN